MEISGVSTSRTQAWRNYSRSLLDGIPQDVQGPLSTRVPAHQPAAANGRGVNYADDCVRR